MTEIDFVLEEIQQIDFDMEYATKVIEPLTQEKSVAPSTEKQEVEPDLGYTGLSKVIVEAVSNEIDENIQPDNIKLGVNILGVQGTFEGGYKVEIEDSTLVFNNGGEVEEGELII